MNIGARISRSFRSAAKAVGTWMSDKAGHIAVGIRYALSTGMPGRWASDHREESNHFTGWNYVAIKALAIQAAQADIAVFQDGAEPVVADKKRSFRKSIRSSKWVRKAYAHDARGGTQLAPNHPLVKLLKRPNPTQSGAMFRYEQIVQLQLTGTCIIWNVMNAMGLPVERYVVPTCMCYPVPPARNLPLGGWRIDGTMSRYAYPVDAQGFSEMQGMFRAVGYVIPAEQVQCIRWPHPIWKDDGYAPLAAGALWSDTAEQMDQSRWSNLKLGPNPSLIITAPPEAANIPEEELDEAAEKFNAKYGGPGNSGKALFVSAGKVENVAHTAKEMDFVGSFPQSRECMLALHGTPAVAVGIAGDGSYAALYAGLKQYVMLTVQPVLDMLAEDDTEHLCPYFGEGLTEEWTAAGVDDPQLIDQQMKNGLAGGVIRKGELRGMLGLEPFGDARDEEIATPPPTGAGAGAGDTSGAGAAAKPKPKPKPSEGDKESADEESTGVSGAPRTMGDGKHINRLLADPVLKAAVEGALSGVRSRDEAVQLADSWKWNSDG